MSERRIARIDHLFVKRFPFVEGGAYPDLGCSVEVFTNADMLELETLGPLARLEPGANLEYVEHWSLFREVPTPLDEDDIRRHVLPKVNSRRGR